MKKITVFGATGMLGEPVTEQLIKDGYDVTVLVRNIEKAQKRFPKGVRFFEGDLQDIKAVSNAVKDADGIYISLSNKNNSKKFNAEKHGLANILQAAKEAQVKQAVFLSSFLARNYQGDWWYYLDKQGGIEQVKKSGIPYTIFYASNFMENFYHGMIMNHKVLIMKHPVQNKSYWIAVADYAVLVSRAFSKDIALDKEYAAQGPEALTMQEVAEEFARNYTKGKLSVSAAPFKVIKLLSYLIPPMRVMIKMAEVNIHNNETFESMKTWTELGKPEITIAQFAKK
ncbi:MAG: SDR family oxidoreductase [Prevotella sp.]|nr:SDR family oxidoreductase [Prevotella sp.]